MKEISTEELLELYNDTMKKCGTYLLNEENDTIAYNIFEEFDIGVHSYLHIDSLTRLFDAGLISRYKFDRSLSLRQSVLDLQNSGEWIMDTFRTSEKWKEIMHLSDSLNETN